MEHSAILLTCTKLPLVFKTFVLSIFEWPLKTGVTNLLGLLRVSEYSDIHGSEFKIEYEYSSLPKSLDRDLFFFLFFLLFLTETRSFSQKGPLKFFTMTTILIDNISYSNTFVSCRLVTPFIGN